ncbi:conserved hypothetical protein [Ricinus communis]|uniref:Uncharacterized protein n=1 Tax=Ricinus communis TaxID=3988 RepID=B9SK99_RICCO|nr:conserved hypothetical protein [Ricinus communis]
MCLDHSLPNLCPRGIIQKLDYAVETIPLELSSMNYRQLVLMLLNYLDSKRF